LAALTQNKKKNTNVWEEKKKKISKGRGESNVWEEAEGREKKEKQKKGHTGERKWTRRNLRRARYCLAKERKGGT